MSTPRRTSVDTATLREMADDAIDYCLSVIQSGNDHPAVRERLARYRKIEKRAGRVRSPLRDAAQQARAAALEDLPRNVHIRFPGGEAS